MMGAHALYKENRRGRDMETVLRDVAAEHATIVKAFTHNPEAFRYATTLRSLFVDSFHSRFIFFPVFFFFPVFSFLFFSSLFFYLFFFYLFFSFFFPLLVLFFPGLYLPVMLTFRQHVSRLINSKIPSVCVLCAHPLAERYVKTLCNHYFCKTCLVRYLAEATNPNAPDEYDANGNYVAPDCTPRCPTCNRELPPDATRTPKKVFFSRCVILFYLQIIFPVLFWFLTLFY
jgi:hypothetical protein